MKRFVEDFENGCGTKDGENLNSDVESRPDIGKIEMFVDNMVQNAIEESVNGLARKRILCVGVVALDYISIVETYPDEDEEVMAIGHFLSRGGNAANSATVLGLLGAHSEFFGTVVKNRDFDFIKKDFRENNVISENIVVLNPAQHKPPVTFIWVGEKTGSRTIVADFKNLTELKASDFKRLDLSSYKWIHFEGRGNVDDISAMIQMIDKFNDNENDANKIKVSVEVEFPSSVFPKHQELFDKADVVFVSKDYGRTEGYNSKEETVKGLITKCKEGATIICPWGEDGAAAMKDTLVTSPAFPPKLVADTIGAGDTFVAGTIFTMCKDADIETAVRFGCRLAGAKCGIRGFSGLKGFQ